MDIELNNDKQMLTSISQLIILNRGNFTKSIVHKRKQRHQLIKRLQKKCKGNDYNKFKIDLNIDNYFFFFSKND